MLRVWGLDFELTKGSNISVHAQITSKVIDEIQRGRLKPKVAMPGTRKLADTLGVNRKTVLLAYTELVEQGWLTTEKNRGTFVSEKLPAVLDRAYSGEPIAGGQQESRELARSAATIQENLIVSGRSNKLGYQDPLGMLSLRQAVLHTLSMQRGLNANLENVCMVRGSQMGIYLAASLIIQDGDHVVLEQLTRPSAEKVFESFSATLMSVGIDQDGVNVDELERLCKKDKVKAIYVTPHHQYPTTVMMSKVRRLRLLQLAEQYGFYIIEDDYAHEFHYSGEAVFPLASYPDSDSVLHVGSLSKILAPGIRLGYLVAPEQLIKQCADKIMMIDIQGNLITEMAVSELMSTGELKRHALKAKKVYQERRYKMEELIRDKLLDFIDFNMPVGGLSFWVEFKQRVSLKKFVSQASENKLSIVPSAIFSDRNGQVIGVRLGFASLNEKELVLAIGRLKKTLNSLYHKQ